MSRMGFVFILLAGPVLASCADPNIAPVPFQLDSVKAAAVIGPNLRTISERDRLIFDQRTGENFVLPTVCTEPSPDAAIAFGRALAANASVTIGGDSGSGAFNSSSTETSTSLEGRTAGVLALRDGLSEACRAYANGVIGQDAYALILSQYGNLLVALAGTGTAGSAAPKFTAQETAVSALLVSCISEHDPTRRGTTLTNPLLSETVCRKLMSGIVAGRLLKSASSPVSGAPKSAANGATVNVTVAAAK
ncbi:hypothetical protein MKK64_03415 [Methylobacterium sp. E-025]|uniref:hypothetical protein n=1 Tax=Methylobacterium sp. E-025 TaxID=2836561 RepID=UPI001FBB2089|nr:hypothetical protein [Methylobacterium sp. E-025]MCJ2110266.1 hypothetical protein [Methylobacterium sp. E-025]